MARRRERERQRICETDIAALQKPWRPDSSDNQWTVLAGDSVLLLRLPRRGRCPVTT